MDAAAIERTLRSRFKFRQLEFLISVADLGSVVRAANHLNTTQPAISRSIREMEDHLGIAIFDRSAQGMAVTDYGDALITHARSIFAELRRAGSHLANLANSESGRLVIGFLPIGPFGPLPKVIARLNRDRPGIHLKLVEGVAETLMVSLQNGEIDLLVGRLSHLGDELGLAKSILYHEEWNVFARWKHPLCQRRALKLKDIVNEKWIMPLESSPLRPLITSFFHAQDLELPSSCIDCSSVLMAREILLNTDNLFLLPANSLDTERQSGLITHLEVDIGNTKQPIGILAQSGRLPTPQELLLGDMLIEATNELGLAGQ